MRFIASGRVASRYLLRN